jgi:ferritin-like metal-binding protein YciE
MKDSLQFLYLDQLSDLVSTETQILEALPKMKAAAANPDLAAAFQSHLNQTLVHAQRLQQIFHDLGAKPADLTSAAMRGIIQTGTMEMQKWKDESVRDAALIASAQRVEHYEMAAYGTARSLAELLQRDQDVELLQTTLDEERETNTLLTVLADLVLNADITR